MRYTNEARHKIQKKTICFNPSTSIFVAFFFKIFFSFHFFSFSFFFFEILQSKLLTLLHGEKTRDEHRMAEQKRKRNGAKT